MYSMGGGVWGPHPSVSVATVFRVNLELLQDSSSISFRLNESKCPQLWAFQVQVCEIPVVVAGKLQTGASVSPDVHLLKKEVYKTPQCLPKENLSLPVFQHMEGFRPLCDSNKIRLKKLRMYNNIIFSKQIYVKDSPYAHFFLCMFLKYISAFGMVHIGYPCARHS